MTSENCGCNPAKKEEKKMANKKQIITTSKKGFLVHYDSIYQGDYTGRVELVSYEDAGKVGINKSDDLESNHNVFCSKSAVLADRHYLPRKTIRVGRIVR